MKFEVFDEILPPTACVACGHVFAPEPDARSFCPRCHTCHAGRRVAPGLQGPYLAQDWMRAVCGVDLYTPIPGFGLVHEGPFYMRGAERIPSQSGFAGLVERGNQMPHGGQGYVIVRLAGFDAKPDRPLPRPGELEAVGTLARKPWGLLLTASSSAHGRLERMGIERAFDVMAAVARAIGMEPVHEPVVAAASSLSHLTAPPSAGVSERSIRCTSCGAPASPDDLSIHSGYGTCPYCLDRVQIPAALASELGHRARQLHAIGAAHQLVGSTLYDRWQGDDVSGQFACAVCAGPVQAMDDPLSGRCPYCGALVIPSAAALASGVGEARERGISKEKQRLANLRASRAAATRNSDRLIALNVGLTASGGVAALATSLAFPIALWNTDAVVPASVSALLMLASYGGPMLGGAYLLARRTRQRAKFGAAWLRLAEQLGADAVIRPSEWLSRWWGASTASFTAASGPTAGFVASSWEGVRFLLGGEVGAANMFYPSRRPELRVLIAVRWSAETPLLKTTRGIRARRARIAEAGFSSCMRRRGFELSADGPTIARLRKNPAQIALLAPVLFEALRVTRLLGGQAVAPSNGG